MNLTLTPLSFVLLTSVVLGSIIAVICWIYPRNAKSSLQLFGTSIFGMTWLVFIFFLSESNLIFHYPHLFSTQFIGVLIYMPFSFFFIRGVLTQQKLSASDLIHGLPLLIFLIDYSPMFSQSGESKLALVASGEASVYSFHRTLFLPPSFHWLVRVLLFVSYTILQLKLVFQNKSHPLARWILPYLLIQFLLIFAYLAVKLFATPPVVWMVMSSLGSGYIILIAVSLLFHPEILYGLAIPSPLDIKYPIRLQEAEADYNSDYEQEKLQHIATEIEKLMKTTSPYLKQGFTIHDLSEELQIPVYQISSFLNHHVGISFNEFVNYYRVNYCKQMIEKGAARAFTLEALAFECGFGNRNSFTSAFKHFTGSTPSDFIRTQKKPELVAKTSK